MALGAAVYTDVFSDLGKVVKATDLLIAQEIAMQAMAVELEGRFDDDVSDLDFFIAWSNVWTSVRTTNIGAQGSAAAMANTYARNLMREKIESTYLSADDLWVHLSELMTAESQDVEANFVGMVPAYVEANDNNNQLSNYGDLAGIDSDNVDAAGILYVSIIADGGGFYHIEAYNDVARGGGDLVGHSATYNSIGAKAILQDNTSEMAGTITVDAVTAADADITVTFSFAGTRTGNGTLSAWAATQMAKDDQIRIECTDVSAGAGAEEWTIFSQQRGTLSGTSGTITTGDAFPADARDLAGFGLTINAGGVNFAEGDQFLFGLMSLDGAVFQTWGRERLRRIWPAVFDGSETIPDTLAE